MELKIEFPCRTLSLEGMLTKGRSEKAVVVSHPHPLYGGNMDNPVVLTIVRAFVEKGMTVLRFNFRGTGNSSGVFDDGRGEQDDVRAALRFLSGSGFTRLYLAGYSFGARVNAAVMSGGCRAKDHVMVSPPAGFMRFDDIVQMPDTGLIVTGDNDEIAPAHIIKTHVKRWKIRPRFETIDGCDHFYSGCLYALFDILTDYLE